MWVNGIAHATFVISAAKHAGHRGDAKLFDIFTCIQVVIHLHDHLALLAMNHEFICASDTWAVEQRVDGKGGIARLNGFKPERREIRELFGRIRKGINRQTARGKTVLIRVIYRTEIARAKERDDIATRQLGRFERAEPGKP
ncbi:hypothetical protein D3C80_793430 [compost metagenome]